MEQRNYTARHAAPGKHERPRQMAPTLEHDPELQKQIRRYQAQRRRKQARRLRILRCAFVVALVAVFALAVVMLTTGRKDPLKGVWALDSTTVYEFDGKGGGSLRLPLGSYAFTYTAEDGTVAIDFADPAASDDVYRYTVKGKTLTLDNGSTVFTLDKSK